MPSPPNKGETPSPTLVALGTLPSKCPYNSEYSLLSLTLDTMDTTHSSASDQDIPYPVVSLAQMAALAEGPSVADIDNSGPPETS
eukprot:10832.XXX_630909_631160_1 [CDS] Oithona nana genome sequencing.